ncbi:hypothetical protein L6164_025256 [Bauhinia variegata]|uniref:Uncharacterized protein n=1 Tax=Bauhinia variegata TaxID=167791 RepID=A0ACB9LZR5_BAUVA|nr:hypothetical protein L6164_025256 [Bauhinia variegata]
MSSSPLMYRNDTALFPSPPSDPKEQPHQKYETVATILASKSLPKDEKFIWPSVDVADALKHELNEPVIDLGGFIRGDSDATARAAQLLREGCMKHGFFQVTNHEVNLDLIRAAYDEVDIIFKQSLEKKLSMRTEPGVVRGYSSAHSHRFSSKLPWKETFTFYYDYNRNDSNHQVVEFFDSSFGEDLKQSGSIYQRYCDAMKELSLVIMDLLSISLGLNRSFFREYFQDGFSYMRLNSYPPCNSANLTLGTGPHSDPNSLTILHQDQVGGLEVLSEGNWKSVRPRPDALVINLGDTFMALTNGIYKSCLHRALVNEAKERRSLVFFVNPREDKVVRAPEELLANGEERKYPDFKWPDMFEFVQKHYRPDVETLPSFVEWFNSTKA